MKPLYRIPPKPVFTPPKRLTFPDHLRGKIFKKNGVWHMQVINKHTNRVVAADNTGSWRTIFDQCDEVTGAIRMSWTMGFGNSAVKE